MTNFRGIAAVTQTLSYVAGNAARAVVPDAAVTVTPPEQQAAGARDAPRLNVYLVQVAPDPVRRNADLPMRNNQGRLVSVPTVALNLRYMLSFFGATARAHLMLGAVEVALHEYAILDAATIELALAGHPDLQGSGLETQVPPVRVVPSPTTLEELSRFWSGFFQMPYTLSTLFEASTVLLQADATPLASLPVAGIQSAPQPGLQPPPPPVPLRPPVLKSVVRDSHTGALTAQLATAVEPYDQVVLGLSGRDASGAPTGHSGQLPALARVKPTATVSFAPPASPSPSLPAGQYVATITIGGVSSMPSRDPATGFFNGPEVDLP